MNAVIGHAEHRLGSRVEVAGGDEVAGGLHLAGVGQAAVADLLGHVDEVLTLLHRDGGEGLAHTSAVALGAVGELDEVLDVHAAGDHAARVLRAGTGTDCHGVFLSFG